MSRGHFVNVLDLFSGIGGFSLGFERAGMRTVAFCEIDPYCRAVLRRHWPDVPVYDDVRTLTRETLADTYCQRCRETRRSEDWGGTCGCGPQVICGGFPCQDISTAGKGAGISGERSGLWSEYARIVGEVRPRYVIVENVAALLGRGIERVLGDLAALGFDAEWHCIPASAVGAPHRRDRVWIVAHANGQPLRGDGYSSDAGSPGSLQGEEHQRQRLRADAATSGGGADVAHAASQRLEGWQRSARPWEALGQPASGSCEVTNTDSQPSQRLAIAWGECGHWLAEPDVGRVAHGVPARVDRLRALGNAVVPQIPEIIGRAIMSAQP